MKILTIITSFLILTASKPIIMNTNASLYDISINSITGEPINFGNFKGKKILIVNTASECGFTGQYEDLEKLYKTYKDKLVVKDIIFLAFEKVFGHNNFSRDNISNQIQFLYDNEQIIPSTISSKIYKTVEHWLVRKKKRLSA